MFGGASAGRYIMAPRGTASSTYIIFDKYDVTKETFEYGIFMTPNFDPAVAGSYFAYDGSNKVYFSSIVSSVKYIYALDVTTHKVEGIGSVPVLQSTGVLGNRMEIITSPSGISYLYVIKNSGMDLFRCPIGWF